LAKVTKVSSLKQRSDWQVSGASFGTSFLAPENLRELHVHTTQVSCSRKWLYAKDSLLYILEKSDLQSIVQSTAEFHDRNLPEIEHVLFLPVSGTSFFVPEKWCQKPRSHQQETCARNLPVKMQL